jgi:hypothetical protein
MGPTGPNVAITVEYLSHLSSLLESFIHSTNGLLLAVDEEFRRQIYTSVLYGGLFPDVHQLLRAPCHPWPLSLYMVVYIGSPRSSFSLLDGQSSGSATPLRQRADCSDVQGLSIAKT